MTKRAFDKIAAGLNEAIDIARGDAKPARLHVPAELDVKAIRARTGLSQADFAHQYGFTADQIKAWEQNRARPLGGVRAYLMMIGIDHEAVAGLLKQARQTRAEKAA
jgi:putative transcriptional regulator